MTRYSHQISDYYFENSSLASFNGGGVGGPSGGSGGSSNSFSSPHSHSNAFSPPFSSTNHQHTPGGGRSADKRHGSFSGSSGGDSGCRLSGSGGGGADSRMGSTDGIQRSTNRGHHPASASFENSNFNRRPSSDNQAFTLIYNDQSGGAAAGSITSSRLSNLSAGVGAFISFRVEHLTSFTMSREDTLWTVDDAIRKLKLQDVKGKIWSQEMQLDITANALNLVDLESGEEIDSFPYNGITHVEAVLLADYHLNSILAFIYRDNTGRKPEIYLFQCDQTPADEVVTDIDSAMLAFKKNKSSKYARAASKSKKKAPVGGHLGVPSYMSASASDLHLQANGGPSSSPRGLRSASPGSTISSASTAQANNPKLFGEPQHLGVRSSRSSDSGSRHGVSNSGERRQEIGRATAQGAAIFAPDYRQRSSYLQDGGSMTYYKEDSVDDLVDNLQVDMDSPHSVQVLGSSPHNNRIPGGDPKSGGAASQKESTVLQQLALRVERQVAILNHCFDDIELFAKQLKKVHDAQQELLKRKKKNADKKKRQSGGDNMLEYRARMPSETNYIDTFQKFKLSFNLLAPLKKHIQQPNAPELVHCLFAPLDKMCEWEPALDMAKGVLSPLLSEAAVQLLENCLNSPERALWTRLGNAWTVSKENWPREHYVPSYKPVFRDGWEPPPLERLPGATEASRSGGNTPNNRSNPTLSYISNFDQDEELDQRPLNDAPRSFAPTPHILATNPRAASAIRESNPGPPVVGKPPSSVVATNDFVARNHKELSVLQDEHLEVVDCSRKWWAVRNSSGQTGYVPSTILTPLLMTSHQNDVTGGHSDVPPTHPTTSTFHHQMQNVVNLSNQMMESKILHNHSVSQPSIPIPVPPPQQQQSFSVQPQSPHRGISQQANRGAVPPPPPPPPPPVVDGDPTEPKNKIIIPKRSAVAPKPKPDNKRNTESGVGGATELVNGESEKLYGASSSRPSSEEVPPHVAAAASGSPKQGSSSSGGAASVITHSSSADQVRNWLAGKGFSKLTVDSLGILNGAQLFSLSRQELTDVCFQEGAKVFSFVTVQKSLANNNNSTSTEHPDANGSGTDPFTHL